MPITPEIFELSVSNDRIKNGIKHGTTTLAFKYKEGIIVAVDSRATAGSFIGTNINKT
jgi:20S proteasome subunit beta 5